MPNYVTNRVTFAANKADEVFAIVIRDGRFDFETLVPSPPNMYHGNLSAEDQKDFPINWLKWSQENWGTKWNAGQSTHGIAEDGRAFIQFDTAWAPPYPVMAAFCNRFAIPFEHRYFDEGSCFWGIDTWGTGVPFSAPGSIQRVERRYKKSEDEEPLKRQLKSYMFEDEESAAPEAKTDG